MGGDKTAHPGEVGAEHTGATKHRQLKNTLPAESCRHYARCAVNKCPLSPCYQNLQTLPTDSQTKCRATKAHRVAVAAQYPDVTPYHGMTRMEYSRTAADNLPERRKIARDPAYLDPDSKVGGSYG